MSCAEVTQSSLKSIWNTAALSNLKKSPILHTSENFLKIYFIEWATSTTTCSIGWSKNRILKIRYNQKMKKRSKMIRVRATRLAVPTQTKIQQPTKTHDPPKKSILSTHRHQPPRHPSFFARTRLLDDYHFTWLNFSKRSPH